MSTPLSSDRSQICSNSATEPTVPSKIIEPLVVLTEFSSFPELAPELRCKIWAAASNEPRNVDIWVRQITIDRNWSNFAPISYFSSTKPVAILHTCRESRLEALKFHFLEFGCTYNLEDYIKPALGAGHRRLPSFEITFPARIYINWDVDRLCIIEPEDFRDPPYDRAYKVYRAKDFARRCGEKKLKYLAINVARSRVWLDDRIYLPSFLIPTDEHLQQLILFRTSVDHGNWRNKTRDLEFRDLEDEAEVAYEDVYEYTVLEAEKEGLILGLGRVAEKEQRAAVKNKIRGTHEAKPFDAESLITSMEIKLSGNTLPVPKPERCSSKLGGERMPPFRFE